jgi:hypothetical protein
VLIEENPWIQWVRFDSAKLFFAAQRFAAQPGRSSRASLLSKTGGQAGMTAQAAAAGRFPTLEK